LNSILCPLDYDRMIILLLDHFPIIVRISCFQKQVLSGFLKIHLKIQEK